MRALRLFGGFVQFHWFGAYGRGKSGNGYSLRFVGSSYKPLFSERNGFRKARYFAGFRFEVLRP